MHAQRLINKLPACALLVSTLVGCATSSPPTPPVTPALAGLVVRLPARQY